MLWPSPLPLPLLPLSRGLSLREKRLEHGPPQSLTNTQTLQDSMLGDPRGPLFLALPVSSAQHTQAGSTHGWPTSHEATRSLSKLNVRDNGSKGDHHSAGGQPTQKQAALGATNSQNAAVQIEHSIIWGNLGKTLRIRYRGPVTIAQKRVLKTQRLSYPGTYDPTSILSGY